MVSKLHLPRKNRATSLLLFLLLPLVGSCADGEGPVDLSQGNSLARLSLAPELLTSLAAEGTPDIVRLRVVATIFGDNEVVGSTEMPVDPNASSWDVGVEISLPAGKGPQIELTVELMSASLATEWSGHIGPLTITPGETTTIPSVQIVRGPLENLAVTGVSITAPSQTRVGKSVTLQTNVTSTSSGGIPTVYWESLSPEVGTVSEAGVFMALSVGTAQVEATAGAATDLVSIQVLPPVDQVVLDPTVASLKALGEQIQFQASVLDATQAVIQGEIVTWTVDASEVLDNQGGGLFVSVGEGTATVTATSASEPGISASAQVDVKQVAVSVEVTPATDTLEAVGETSQFSAQAFDSNDNPIPAAVFEWSSAETSVATVDQSGLATAQGGGTTSIKAEVLEALTSGSPGSSPPQEGGGTGVFGTALLVVDLPLVLTLTPDPHTLDAIDATVQMTPVATDGSGEPVTGLSYGWTSSDPTVATVDQSGLVTAVTNGMATITVTSAGVSATAEITVEQAVAALRWVQQPTSVFLWDIITPPPSVEAVDANGYRVESFDGEISLGAEWLGFGPTPPQGSPSQNPPPLNRPQLNVSGHTIIAAVSGLSLFDHLRMIDTPGLYRLQASATLLGVVLTVWSVTFTAIY